TFAAHANLFRNFRCGQTYSEFHFILASLLKLINNQRPLYQRIQKRASTVLAIVHGRAEPFVDVNMVRLLGRYFGLPARAGGSKERQVGTLGHQLVSGEHGLEVNWAVLDFAALVCRAKRPLCPRCPLRTRCRYRAPTPGRPTPTPGAASGSRSAAGR